MKSKVCDFIQVARKLRKHTANAMQLLAFRMSLWCITSRREVLVKPNYRRQNCSLAAAHRRNWSRKCRETAIPRLALLTRLQSSMFLMGRKGSAAPSRQCEFCHQKVSARAAIKIDESSFQHSLSTNTSSHGYISLL